MRKPAWGGNPPSDDEQARERILEAAKRAVLRDGIASTSVASIAREAGITRQTFYRYFADGQEVLRNAEIRAGGGLVEALVRHSLSFEKLDERLTEGLLFLAREVPKHPLLSRHFEPDRAATVTSDAAVDYAAQYVQTIWTDEFPRPTKAKARVLAELQLRILFSLVALPRQGRELRRFVNDAVRPAIRGWLEHEARRVDARP